MNMSQPIYDSGNGQLRTRISVAGHVLQNVQPILERRLDSIWSRVERTRDEICNALREACEREEFDALVIKSRPFEHPAWVKLECWIPTSSEVGRAVTERGSALITIEAREFHRYELEYSVELNDRGWSKAYRRLGGFDSKHVDQIVRFLLLRGPKPALADLELRMFTLRRIWKPANKVNVLRRDWLRLAPALLIAFGVIFLPLPLLGLLGLLSLVVAAVVLYLLHERRTVVLSPGKPLAEPRNLTAVDTWQVVVSGLGPDVELLRQRFFTVLRDPSIAELRSRDEAIWYWGIDGTVEREQIVLTFRRGILFCQIYAYDQELYVGWDAHLNRGQWVEKTVSIGIHKENGELTSVNTVQPGSQSLTEYDVTDVNCLIEWTHAKLVQLVKSLMEERKIDQEIDFTILRGERQNLTTPRRMAEGLQETARQATRKLVRTG